MPPQLPPILPRPKLEPASGWAQAKEREWRHLPVSWKALPGILVDSFRSE